MKKTAAFFILLVFVSACQPAFEPMGEATSVPSKMPEPSIPPTSTATKCPPTPIPTLPGATSPDYNGQFLDAIGTTGESCLPDGTTADIGIYIYDLANGRELVSINADTPFQFASAFKAPVLVYFLSSCKQYWDTGSPEWETYFRDTTSVRNQWYVGDEYREQVIPYLSDVDNWQKLEAFFVRARPVNNNGEYGPIDQRYFILQQVYRMIANSSNADTADVLRFVHDHCLGDSQPVIEKRCGGPNAITVFNAWFDEFAGIVYQGDEPRRGLYNWNVIYEKDEDGNWSQVPLSTNGLKDQCASQTTVLNCGAGEPVKNVMSPRDFFSFYLALYHLDDASTRMSALDLLKIDLAGSARGSLKNMARNMDAEAMSKNGYYYFKGAIVADAGIVQYRDASFIVVTLSYDAGDEIESLYGTYDAQGALTGSPGLIRSMLEEIAR